MTALSKAAQRFSLLIWFAVFGNLPNLAQELKPVLITELGNANCELLLANSDLFLFELANNPNDVGLVVIYNDGRSPIGLSKILSTNLYMRRFDRTRVKIILAEGHGDGRTVSFWRIPPRANSPKFSEIRMPAVDASRRFLFAVDFTDNVCQSFSPDLFGELIRANPGSRARVVITGRNWFERKLAGDGVLETLTKQGLIPRNRIDLVYIYKSKEVLTLEEYWFIPARRK